jgi:penicillin-binding protein 2
MFGTSKIKDHYREQRLFGGRIVFSAMAVAALLLIVIARLFFLQIIKHSYFSDLSQGNRVRLESLPPDRGLIYDSQGTVVAENTPAYQLELVPERVSDVPNTLARLADLHLIDHDTVPGLTRLIRTGRRFQAVPLRLSLSEMDIAVFSVRQHEFPGVEIRTRLARWYPFGAQAVHALGYVATISEEDLKHIDRDQYSGSALIGKIGLENTYEQELHGFSGYRQVLVNAQGRRVDKLGGTTVHLETRKPTAGNDLFIGIDMRLQHIAEEGLAGKRGAVVAIDPKTGNVLTLASVPTYDPNKFTRGISTNEYATLRDNIDRPLFNRALRGTYPPGSTVKPMMALAGLEYGVVDPNAVRNCTGGFTLPGSSHVYHDWKPSGHGPVDMKHAIATSCDIYFYGLAEVLGIDRVHEAMTGLGFGRLSGIDIGGEKTGIMPSAAWKMATYKQQWYPGETVIVGIGQGYLTATPVQLAHAAAIVAARGRNFRPRIVTAIRDATTQETRKLDPIEEPVVQLRDAGLWDTVIEGMEMVARPGGTASSSFSGAAYRVAAKTGTAQVFSLGQNQKYNAASVAERLRDHALFIAFAPADDPKIAIAVLVENGGHGGSAAAPIARRIFDAYLLGKYEQTPKPTAPPPGATMEDLDEVH